jgi:hypothetical protein
VELLLCLLERLSFGAADLRSGDPLSARPLSAVCQRGYNHFTKQEDGMSNNGRESTTVLLEDGLDVLDEDLGLYDHWVLIRPFMQKILLCTLSAVVTTVLVTAFVLPSWYRAQAVLRPASQETQNQQAVMASASGIMSSLGSSVSSALGLGGNDNDAQEFMAILASYDFTIGLVQKYQLQPHLLPPTFVRRLEQQLGLNPYTSWKGFWKMQSRLSVNYDLEAGNLTLGFEDKDPEMAKRVLHYYIYELRDLLRKRAASVATVAVDSLERENAKTADILLQQQIDQLVAQQLQNKLTAEMQSDFAFTVEDSPSTPDLPSDPWLVINTLLALGLTPLCCIFWVVFHERVYKPNVARYERRLWMRSPENSNELPLGENQSDNTTLRQVRDR